MKKIVFALIVVVALGSCRKYPDFNDLTYQPIVVTYHDSTANFGKYKTYYMPTYVRKIADDSKDSIFDAKYGDPILDAIEKNMASRGYTRVNNTFTADLGIEAAAITITNIAYYDPYYYYGWGGYYGWYYPYYPYYPYYGYSYSYTYTTGSLMVQMGDLANKDTVTNKIRFLWTNFNAGVLGSSSTYNSTAGVNAVNQAFNQSAYIKTN